MLRGSNTLILKILSQEEHVLVVLLLKMRSVWMRSLSLFAFATDRRLGKGEKHDLFTCYGAYVMVQANHFDPHDALNHFLQGRSSRLHQLRPHLLYQSPAGLRMERLDELLLGRGHDAAEANDQKITNEVRLDGLGATANVFLFKAAHSFANSGFDFALCFHNGLECV